MLVVASPVSETLSKRPFSGSSTSRKKLEYISTVRPPWSSPASSFPCASKKVTFVCWKSLVLLKLAAPRPDEKSRSTSPHSTLRRSEIFHGLLRAVLLGRYSSKVSTCCRNAMKRARKSSASKRSRFDVPWLSVSAVAAASRRSAASCARLDAWATEAACPPWSKRAATAASALIRARFSAFSFSRSASTSSLSVAACKSCCTSSACRCDRMLLPATSICACVRFGTRSACSMRATSVALTPSVPSFRFSRATRSSATFMARTYASYGSNGQHCAISLCVKPQLRHVSIENEGASSANV
mmetsp:Transcript_15933/g.36456  ORF Transcript_15933/g.36456 Transcript_15933/m.36456 type:complete len:299 (+) Transcript_15933:257-1153(+)